MRGWLSGRKAVADWNRKKEEEVVNDKLGEISLCCHHSSVRFDESRGHNF